MEEKSHYRARPGPRLWRIVVVTLVIGLAVGLLASRPWEDLHPECTVIVRPGESIQAAIDAAQPGDVICLARGEWTESLVIDKSLTLAGRGSGRTIIGQHQFHLPAVEIASSGGQQVTVKLQGLSVSSEVGHTGVTVSGTARVDLSRFRVSDMLYGIQVSDSARLTLSNSSVSDCRQIGIVLLDSATVEIAESHVVDNRALGIRIFGSAEAVIRDSQVSRNGGHGLMLRDDARVTVIDSSVYDNGMRGLSLAGQSHAQLLASGVSRNGEEGIRAEDLAVVEVTGSRVIDNWEGIELVGSARATITDARISANRFAGVRVEESAHATVSGTVLSSNRRGLDLRSSATAGVEDCLFEDNEDYGLVSRSTGEVTGEANRFHDNGVDLGGNLSGTLRLPLREPAEVLIEWPDQRFDSLQEAVDALLPGGKLTIGPGTYTAGLTIATGVFLEAVDGEVTIIGKKETLPVLSLVDGADLRLEGVTVSGGSSGLSLSAGARAELVGCTITANTQGLHLSGYSSVDMTDCSIVGNARSGLFAAGESAATITRCSVSNHAEYGVAAANSARLTVSATVITRCGWDGGVVLWDNAQAVLEDNEIINNPGFGVAVYSHRCFQGVFLPFRGHITGRDNTLSGNWRGDFCPPELGFLTTPEGGELDLRPAL